MAERLAVLLAFALVASSVGECDAGEQVCEEVAMLQSAKVAPVDLATITGGRKAEDETTCKAQGQKCGFGLTKGKKCCTGSVCRGYAIFSGGTCVDASSSLLQASVNVSVEAAEAIAADLASITGRVIVTEK